MQDWSPPQDGSYRPESRYLEELFLLELGQIPKITVDTLLAYAYMQKGVVQANIEIDMDLPNEMRQPKVKIVMQVKQKIRYKLAVLGLRTGGILGKSLYILMTLLGAPTYAGNAVKALASNYLPAKYQVDVQVETKPIKLQQLPEGFSQIPLD